MPREYYNNLETVKSMEVLQKISKEVDFVLIGGWAVNYLVKQQKSKDVDIVIDIGQLAYLKKYGIEDYGGINVKYSIVDGIYVDLFILGISDNELTIPIKKILMTYDTVEGIKVVDRNILLLLKLCGYFRENKDKIDKDIIDVVSLIFYGGINFETVGGYIRQYKIDERRGRTGLLEYLDKGEPLWEFITDSKQEYKRLKAKYKREISSIQP